tara:strand:+ start:505 stop:4188 length:3684 start_codon:yes stop_codon:yes gene_type:complete
MATRQDILFAAEDFTAVYQSFAQANFKAYDFDSIKASMVDYIRLNYPEDYNDWIQSSEFVSLIDLIAYIGHSLAFRLDFAVRENFMETAQARESVLRLARFLGYNPIRNKNSVGKIKVKSVRTDEIIIDSDGNSIANTDIVWNDSANSNAYEQFLSIMNSAFNSTSQFGTPFKSGISDGIKTEIYDINSILKQNVVYNFSTSINGEPTDFEICNVDFSSTMGFSEVAPDPNSSFKCIYLNDGKGNASTNTGFFFYFKQGTLNFKDTLIQTPIENQVIDINVNNICEDDVWVQTISQDGTVNALWTKVQNTVGSNVIFNAVENNLRNIYQVVTRTNDNISIKFADGRFGNAPKGIIRTWYRSTNGNSYTIRPEDMSNIEFSIPYYSRTDGQLYNLSIVADLEEPISNSAITETTASIQNKAPLVYSTQNRMITASDYAVYPLQASSDIKKIKSTNRIHSGHSRYVDVNDPTGTYKDLTIFGDDGYMFEEETYVRKTLALPSSLNDTAIIEQYIQPLLEEPEVENFYYQKYKDNFIGGTSSSTTVYWKTTDEATQAANMWEWNRVSGTDKMSTGYFTANTTNTLVIAVRNENTTNSIGKIIEEGCNIEFVQPNADGTYTDTSPTTWASVTSIDNDGRGITDTSLAYTGKTTEGYGAIHLSRNIPTNVRIKSIAPAYNRKFDSTELTNISTQLGLKNSFGIRFDHENSQWEIILAANLGSSQTGAFSLSSENTSGNNTDYSYLIRIEYQTDQWVFIGRAIKYNFGSVNNVRFFNQQLEEKVSKITKKAIKDQIRILNINLAPLSTWSSVTTYAIGDQVKLSGVAYQSLANSNTNQAPATQTTYWKVITSPDNLSNTLLTTDYDFDISGYYTYDDGYSDPRRVLLKFADENRDYVVDNPYSFDQIVGTETIYIQDEIIDNYTYKTLMTSPPPLKADGTVNTWSSATTYSVGDKVEYNGAEYESKTNVNLGNLTTNPTYWKWTRNLSYTAYTGRSNLRFKWKHASSSDVRIDPAVTNIVDTFVLTNSYHTAFANWLKNDRRATTRPLEFTTEQLKGMFTSIESAKSSSDTIIYKSAQYKILFGSEADYALQAKFKVVKNPTTNLTDNEIKAQIINYIDLYFDPDNWNFGETFYFTELAGYIHRQMIGIISSIVIVPTDSGSRFGNMFQVTPNANELFISAAKVSDIQIVDSYTESNIRIAAGQIEGQTATTTITGVSANTSSGSSSSGGSYY